MKRDDFRYPKRDHVSSQFFGDSSRVEILLERVASSSVGGYFMHLHQHSKGGQIYRRSYDSGQGSYV